MKKIKLVTFILGYLFLQNINAQQVEFGFAKDLGGKYGQTIITDDSGNVYCAGTFIFKSDFDPGPDSFFLTPKGDYDVFVTKLTKNGDFVWAKSYGGTDNDNIAGMGFDTHGDLYLAGDFEGVSDFDMGTNDYSLTSNGGKDIYLLKVDKQGEFIWAKSFGGAKDDNVTVFHIDNEGSIILSGKFYESVDFDPGPAAKLLSSAENFDIYSAKYKENGELDWVLQWQLKLSAYINDIKSIASDIQGNVFIGGTFYDTMNADFGSGTSNLFSPGKNNAFISKYDKSGQFIWVKQFNSTETSLINVDLNSNLIITGLFGGSINLEPGNSKYPLVPFGASDIYVAKMDKDGNIIWVKSFGGEFADGTSSLASDLNGNIYILGDLGDSIDFDPNNGKYYLESNGANDIFLSKLNTQGDFQWAFSTGDMLNDGGSYVSVDKFGSVYVTGFYRGKCDFDPSSDTFYLNSNFAFRAFALKLNQSGFGSVVNRFIKPVKIYPNPNQGVLNIELNKVKKYLMLTLKNSMGQILMQQNYEQVKDIALDLDQEAGIYFLEIKTDQNAYQMLKVVKQ